MFEYKTNIKNYNNYILENIIENKKYIFIISDKLRDLFNDMISPISKKILVFIDEKKEFDISFLDYIHDKEKNDKITYLPISKYIQNNDINVWETKMRQEMSIGRLVNKLFPDVFNQSEIEKFVNEFKSKISKFFSNFRLVEGEDIRKYYLLNNYESNNHGDINHSCMRSKDAQSYLDIYVNNSDKCKLLILMSDLYKDKIKGRAIVWFGTRKPVNKIYMDRIYTIKSSDDILYKDYAEKKGWIYKSNKIMGDSTYIENGKRIFESVSIQLKAIKYKEYPSLDTLSYYTPRSGRLASNIGNYIPGYTRYHLNSPHGNATKLDK